ncbi:MAG: glycine--tRNA ligase subunit beta, partial [Nitrospiraceae bacterium]
MTSMKEHQGFFSVLRKDGTLLPAFVSITNMKLPNMRLIQAGNERVLAARLADAKFFFDEDRKVRLADRVEKLKGVTFHKKIGTQYDRVRRITELVKFLAGGPNASPFQNTDAELPGTCDRAAQLSKADLLTGIVGEFPALQGVMGGEYARHDGEPDAVCHAIAEHYLPRFADDELPQTQAGMILSLADRLDTVFAFFRVGLIPSGSEDPFGLRRHALAIVRIVLEGQVALDLGATEQAIGNIMKEKGIARVGDHNPSDFILDRLRYYGRTAAQLRDDVMDAVLKPADRPALILTTLSQKMKTLQSFTTRAEFDPLIVGFKRAHRIVEKENWKLDEVNPTLVQHPSEVELHKSLEDVRLKVPFAIEQGHFGTALEELVRLKPAIDAFFAGVMVNAEDEGLRKNRLSLLYGIDRLFISFADFSQISVPST